jgi:putative transposase
LNAAEWLRLGFLMTIVPPVTLPAGSKSTYTPVRKSAATSDITYIPTWSGFLYLAMVLDVYSRKIVGWAMDTNLKTALILQALEMAIVQRQPSGVIHHSDRGCQYTPAMPSASVAGRLVSCPRWDRWGTPTTTRWLRVSSPRWNRELLNRRRFRSPAEARMAVFEWHGRSIKSVPIGKPAD